MTSAMRGMSSALVVQLRLKWRSTEDTSTFSSIIANLNIRIESKFRGFSYSKRQSHYLLGCLIDMVGCVDQLFLASFKNSQMLFSLFTRQQVPIEVFMFQAVF